VAVLSRVRAVGQRNACYTGHSALSGRRHHERTLTQANIVQMSSCGRPLDQRWEGECSRKVILPYEGNAILSPCLLLAMARPQMQSSGQEMASESRILVLCLGTVGRAVTEEVVVVIRGRPRSLAGEEAS
jgi:hypothetical protein